MNCKIPYIENNYRKVSAKLADRLNNIHNEAFKAIADSNLFRKYGEGTNATYLFSKVGTEANVKQRDLIKKINAKYNVPEGQSIVKLELTKAGSPKAKIVVHPIARQEYNNLNPQQTLFQKAELPVSNASVATIAKMKEAAKKMGINLQELASYAKQTGLDTTNINGVADLVRGIVAIATGKEADAITEETVHIATAIMEQTNPTLVTSMIAKIDRFKIYNETLKAYRDNKAYQLPNGKPDIRKIKKEAVDKLIAELIVNDGENTDQYPELKELTNRSMVRRLWDAILDYIRGIYEKADINVFEQAALKIAEGEVEGTVADIKTDGIFLQVQDDNVDGMYNKIMDIDSRMELIPELDDKKRHYKLDGVEVDKTVTEKLSEGKTLPTFSEEKQAEYDQMAKWGDEGHMFIKDYISGSLIDDKGYAIENPIDVPFNTKLGTALQKDLKAFAKKLIGSYKPGTRFVVERKVINENVKGNLASTIDFIAIEPDETTGYKLDILDWKFTTVKTDAEYADIPWYKKGDWKLQMGEYAKIMYNYGIKSNQLRKTRMVPFIAGYNNNIAGDPESGLRLTTLEIGDLNDPKNTELYLLPVPLDTESTGNKEVDALLTSLRTQYDKMYKVLVSPEDQPTKELQLNELERAIRTLHMQMDFAPLAFVGTTFVNNAKKALKSFVDIDYSTMSKEEISDKLKQLLEFRKSAEKFTSIDDIYASTIDRDNLSNEEKEILKSLKEVDNYTEELIGTIAAIQEEYVKWLAAEEEVVAPGDEDSVLDAEVEVDKFARTFLEGSKLASVLNRLGSKLILQARSLVNIVFSEKVSDYTPKLLALEKEAAAKGKSAFDLIGRVTDSGLALINKIDTEFFKRREDAQKAGDTKFFLDNMDLDKYKELLQQTLNKRIDDIESRYTTESEEDKRQRKYRITELQQSIDINDPNFNGFYDKSFLHLFNQSVKETENYSAEYKEMAKSEAALAVWEYLTNLNVEARKMGYLVKKSNSFFPLIEATTLQKFSQTGYDIKEIRDFFTDSYKVKVNEEQTYSKTDPETNKVRKEIPKLFTRTDKAVNELSRDLNKVMALWTKSLLEYKAQKELESTLLTLHTIEKNKGHVVVDEKGNVVFEGGEPKIDTSSNKNAEILQTIADDYLYGLNENLGSFGNIQIGSAVDKLSKGTEEEKDKKKVSIKKGLNTLNRYTQGLAVGVKALVAIPNFFGNQFQAIINSGDLISGKEWLKNEGLAIIPGGLSTIDKGLINLVVPLNDDIATEQQRIVAGKQGFIKYLSTWTINDIMMATNSFPEKKIQIATAKTFNDTSMVENGKIVNIRQFVRKQDQDKYKKDSAGKRIMSEADRKALDKTFEARVKELQNTRSLTKIAEIQDDKVVIPGVSQEELAKYRVKVIDYGRNINGQMSLDDKADYRRDSLFKSFMMFKNWIPKQVYIRAGDIQKNEKVGEWEYGRARLFLKVWNHTGFTAISSLRDIISANDKGLAILDKILQEKKQEYYKKTGKELKITEEEFYDLVRKQINNQFKELGILFALMGLVLAAKAAKPPDDADDLTKNRYKFWAKAINKISDELAFYYNPTSAESITKGSIMPALGLLSKIEKIGVNLASEGYGFAAGDEKMMEKSHPLKYTLDVIPFVSQFDREILPILFPELAKEMGIRTTTQSRQ